MQTQSRSLKSLAAIFALAVLFSHGLACQPEQAPPPGTASPATAASPAAPPATPPVTPLAGTTGDWLIYGNTSEPTTLNCVRATEWFARMICRLTCDSLIDFDQSFHFIPRLAESYDYSADGLTLVFHLRKGVRWHDGAALTARDVIDTVERIRQLRKAVGPMPDSTPAIRESRDRGW